MKRLMNQLIPALLMGTLSTSALGYQEDEYDDDISIMYTEIDFPGGLLSEYLEVIEEAFDDETTFMVLPPAENFLVPAINGLLSSPENALDAISGISMELTYPNGRVYPTTISWTFVDDFMLRIDPVKGRQSRPVEEPSSPKATTTQVYELAQLTDNGYSMENILGTMQVGFEMSASGVPMIRFHEPTSVLFVKGDWKQLEILDGVIEVLRSASERDTRNKELEAEAARMVEEAQAQTRAVRNQLDMSHEEIKLARDKSADLSYYLRGELSKIEIERDRLEAQVRNLEEILQMFGPLEKTFAEYAKFQKQAEKSAAPE